MNTEPIIAGEYRLSPQQNHIWTLQRFEQSSPYVTVCAALIEGEVDLKFLRQAINSATDRNEILRTTFKHIADARMALQVVNESLKPIINEADFSGLDYEELEARVEALFQQLRGYPLDVENGPVVQAILINGGPRRRILLVRLPALCEDGMGLRQLIERIAADCAGLTNYSRPFEAMQYADVTEWLNEFLESEDMEVGRHYWRSLFESAPQISKLYFENRERKGPEFNPQSRRVTIHPETVEKISIIANEREATLATLLMTSFQVLIWKTNGQNDSFIGLISDGRPYEELKGAQGLFARCLPIRAFLDGALQFTSLMRETRKRIGEALRWQMSFSPEHHPAILDSQTGLCFLPFCFEYNEQSAREVSAGLKISFLNEYACIDRFNIKLTCMLKDSALTLDFHFDANLYSDADINQLGEQFEVLLESAAANPDHPLSELDILGERMRHQLLVEWNATQIDIPGEQCIHRLFEAQAERKADSVALIFEGEQLSYEELNSRANQLAHYLIAAGVTQEVLVGIMMNRSVDMIISLLAVLKAGAAYVPLDPSYPSERLAFMLNNSGATVLLTQSISNASLLSERAEPIFIDAEWQQISKYERSNPTSYVLPDNLIYVIYTSGSTGKPKGVQIKHTAVTNFLKSMREQQEFTDQDSLLGVTTLSFDIAALELFLPLTEGATLILASVEDSYDGKRLLNILENYNVSLMQATPATWQMLIDSEWSAAKGLKILCGGEALNLSLARKLLDKSAWLFNLYGPTETTIWSCICRVAPQDKLITIGRPIANTQTYVLDAHFQPLPVGVNGELFISGHGLARGYLNQPDLTADRFIPNPFSSSPGSRMYRSGDIARLLPDSNLLFLGRADHQVKIRGFRIELAEVEAAIRLHHLVSDCAVVSSSSPGPDSTSNRLLAYVVSDIPAHLLSTSLREWLKLKLPDFMLPSLFIPIPGLPLTTNGKLDRKALPPPESSGSASQLGFQPARTPVEQQLVSIWSDVLGVASPGINDNFFDLGGHSLLATQLISRLRLVFNLDLDLKLVFDSPTILEQASFIHLRLADADPSRSSPQILAVPRLDPLPLSFAQQRLWFLDQLDPHSFAYNISCAVLLSGQLNLLALRHSINHIIRRHESLRTSFDSLDGKPVQIISQQFDLDIEVVDLSELAESQRQPRAVQLAGELGRQGFDLSRLPLLRACVFKLDDLTHILAVTLHHIISDGWSMGLIVKELASLYNAFVDGRQPLLEPLPIQYGDYAVWQRQWLSGQLLDRQLCYWKQQLAGPLPVLQMPTDRPRPPSQSFKGSSVPLRLKPELTHQLKAMARREGVTLYMLLLAAFYSLLFRYTSQLDIILGTPVANRALPEVEGLIGFFVNTLAIRVRMEADQPFASLLSMVRQQCLGAYANQDVPFEKLVAELQPERSLSHSPLFQVLFAFQQQVIRSAPMRGLDLEQVELTSGISKFDLSLSFTEQAHHLEGVLEYSGELFDEQSMWRMMGHLEVLLEAIARNPLTAVAHLPMLTIEEMKQLQAWNQNASPYDSSLTIGEMIERQGDQRGDSVAVVSGELHLTYRQMNRRANQLSRYMRRLGVGPEQRVGVLMARGAKMVEAVVAVLKSGAAYVPLDAEYPLERLDFMMRDGGVSLLLTQKGKAEAMRLEGMRVVEVEEERVEIEKESGGAIEAEVEQENLAYIIYTSGSTGVQKGVAVTYRGLPNLVRVQREAFAVDSTSRVLQFASLSFDASVSEILVTLLSGACLYLLPKDSCLPGPTLIETLNTYGIDSITLPPSALTVMESADVPNLTTLVVAGEACPLTLAQQWSINRRFINAYGPTEGTVCSTLAECDQHRHTVTIGRPITNVHIYLLDTYLQPAPVGVNGELFISGHGLARGYLNQPDLTADRFIPNPFSSSPGSRMYRTGDIARLLPDSNLLFLGRADHQVKIRGFRIELAEVEAAIRLHHLVSDCVVVSSSSPGCDSTSNRLVAYVVSDIPAHLLSTSLREWLKLKLPDFMLPSLFIPIPGLPLTSNGKLDRKALPLPEFSGSASQPGFQAARTPVEQQLVSIWSEVLGVTSPGINDNFFDLGGDSILAVQVISRARAAGLHLSTSLLFQNQTIASLALVVDSRSLVLAQQSELSGPLPLTPIQLWFLLLHPDSPHHYNQSLLLESSLPLDPLLLRQALALLCRHHDALRLRFRFHLDAWHQSIIPFDDELLLDSFSTFDLADLPDHLVSSHISNLADRLQASLNISQGPIFRLALFKTGSQRPDRLLWIIHHLGVDAVSWRILLEDLESCYGQLSGGDEVSFSPKTTSYKEWAEALLRYSQSGQLSRQLPYWQGVQEADFDRLGVSDEGADNCLSSEASLSLSLDQPRTARLLKQVPKVFATEINEVLLLALAEAMNRRAGISRLKVDLEGHGREEIDEQVDVTRTVGWFTSIYPVVIEVKQGDSIEQKVRRVKRTLREVPDKGIGYGVIRYLGAGAEGEGQAMREAANQWKASEAEVSFNYLGQVDQAAASFRLLRAGRESKGRERSEAGSRKYLIEVNSGVVGGELEVNWSYSRNKHSREEVEGMAREYISALSDFIDYALSTDANTSNFLEFSDLQWSQDEIDDISAVLKDLY